MPTIRIRQGQARATDLFVPMKSGHAQRSSSSICSAAIAAPKKVPPTRAKRSAASVAMKRTPPTPLPLATRSTRPATTLAVV